MHIGPYASLLPGNGFEPAPWWRELSEVVGLLWLWIYGPAR